MDYLLLIAGLIVLVFGGDFLVKGAVTISQKFHISPLVIGVTVVSCATSAPELLVSLNAAVSGHTDITLGNVIGSNIANIGLVLGCTAFLFTLPVQRQSIKIDWPMMMLCYALFFVCFFFDTKLGYIDGFVFVLLLSGFTVFIIKKSRKENKIKISEEDYIEPPKPMVYGIVFLCLGGVALYLGSEWLISGATSLAQTWGVSERIISLTVVAIGTSIPELAASLVAAYKKEGDIAIGNLIGSNIFNILAVLGITSMIHPVDLNDEQLIKVDFPWMLAFSIALLPMMLISRRMRISKIEGLLLLLAYCIYIIRIL